MPQWYASTMVNLFHIFTQISCWRRTMGYMPCTHDTKHTLIRIYPLYTNTNTIGRTYPLKFDKNLTCLPSSVVSCLRSRPKHLDGIIQARQTTHTKSFPGCHVHYLALIQCLGTKQINIFNILWIYDSSQLIICVLCLLNVNIIWVEVWFKTPIYLRQLAIFSHDAATSCVSEKKTTH